MDLRPFVLLICFSITSCLVYAQTFTVQGMVRDIDSDKGIELVSIYQKGTTNAVESDLDGNYKIKLTAEKSAVLVFSRIGYQPTEFNVPALAEGITRTVNVSMAAMSSDLDIVIRESRIEDLGMIREDVESVKKIPSTSGNFESILPSIALGASSGQGGELTSQYNVRGGNYDENLVYVNDFEIFRPQLIRAGQQEGLSFPNIDLIRDLSFSSGGFEAKYGDKLSSVLDISYKRPEETKSSFSASLLGASVHTEGSFGIGKQKNKLRYLLGLRYKDTRYILGSLPVQGEYTPRFTDLQTYITYDINDDLQLGYLGNINTSVFDFIPSSSSRSTGLVNQTIELNTNFEGQETTRFRQNMNGLSLTYLPDRTENPIFLKLLGSTFKSLENETFDIVGFYRLSQIETSLGAENAGEEIAVLGTGTQHLFARNDLNYSVNTLHHKGGIEFNVDTEKAERSHFIQWGAKWRRESIDDDLHEWERIDSAGFSLPFDENQVLIASLINSENDLSSNRYSAYVQNTFSHYEPGKSELKATGGIRLAHWDLTDETIISPRFQVLYKPLGNERDYTFKLSGGVYYQAPFYRELRRPDGSVNLNLRSQRSVQLVAGLSRNIDWPNISDKPFKFIAELYYKKLDDLVSYEIDNVRIRYSGENDSNGSVIGLDMRLNGEFVPGAESWFNLSILSARENLLDVEHRARAIGELEGVPVNTVPRPTDQLLTVGMFFQDYLPNNDKSKVHMNLSFGTGLPFGLKDANDVFRNTFRFNPYHRIDIGFSYELWDASKRHRNSRSPFLFSNNAWISLEVFNLMQVQNQASITWIKTVGNTQFAIPNFLSSRRINLKLRVDI